MGRRRKVVVAESNTDENTEDVPKQTKKQSCKEKPAKKFKNEPDWMSGDGDFVVQLILSIQKSDCNSGKIIAELTKLYNKVS